MITISVPWRNKSRPGRQKSDASSSSSLTTTPTPASQESPELQSLNECLQTLVSLFPNVQPEVFREMLLNFSEESRIQLITEALLKEGNDYIRGRFRAPQASQDQSADTTVRSDDIPGSMAYKYKKQEVMDSRGQPIAKEERFRNKSYREAVKTQLTQEFKNLSQSTVRAVLAEYNFSYTYARPTLLELNAKSWRYSISQWFSKKKQTGAEEHPSVEYVRDRAGGPPIPRLISTRNFELDMELYDGLIAPKLAARRAELIAQDHQFAIELSVKQAEPLNEMYDCECCFIPNAMEQMAACDDDAHLICFTCIRHTTNEALFGQGWVRSIDLDQTTLRCMAPGNSECPGRIPSASLQIALTTAEDGIETYNKLLQRFTAETLLKSELPLIQCPFCPYAEIDSIALANPALPIRLDYAAIIPTPEATHGVIPMNALLHSILVALQSLLLLLLFSLYLFFNSFFQCAVPLPVALNAALSRVAHKRRGLRFTCLSPLCSRASCLTCHSAWHDIHKCHEIALQSLRTTIELATSAAIKRVCPQCSTSFIKESGCNKMRCTCGYTMCYVCREKIGSEGYAHFCQHFRINPGRPCPECEKCDLYRTEDEDAVVRRAREKAEKDWVDRQEGRVSLEGLEKREWEDWVDRLVDRVIARS